MHPSIDYLKGVGHFTIWFCLGWCIFWLLQGWRPSRRFAIFGPFMPFFFGAAGAFPYILVTLGVDGAGWAGSGFIRIFLLYDWLNRVSVFVRLFSDFHVDVLILSVLYGGILLHYNRLIRRLRRKYAK